MSEALWIVIGIGSTLAVIKRKLKIQGKTLIKIQGHLKGKWKECIEGMEISYERNNTILTGHIKDEAQMNGILNIIRNYKLKLISINPVERFHLEQFF